MSYVGLRRLLVLLTATAALLGSGVAAPPAMASPRPDVTATRTSTASTSTPSTTAGPATTQAPGSFVAINPMRVMDTRRGLGTVGPVTYGNHSFSAHVLGRGGVPSSGVGYVTVTVTVTAPTSSGYVTPYTATAVNFVAGQTVADFTVAPVDSAGNITFAAVTPGNLQLVVDVNGYVRAGTASLSGLLDGDFSPDPGCRLLDTRQSGARLPVAPYGSVTVHLYANHAGRLSAGLLTVAVTQPKAAGSLTVSPAGSPRPLASTLNFVAGQTVANAVLASANAAGDVTITNNSGGTTHVVVDELASVGAGTPQADGTIVGSTPSRVVDTRRSLGANGPVTAGSAIRVQLLGRGTVPPSGVTAVALNVTATGGTGAGYVTAYPGGGVRPTSSILNYARGQTVPGLTIVPVGADGSVTLAVGGSGTAHLVVDVEGYVATGATSSATTTWTRTTGVDPSGGRPGITACSSRTFCLTIDTTQRTYTFDGSTWTKQAALMYGGWVDALSCASPTWCVGAKGTVLMIWNGSSWAVDHPFGSGQGSVNAVSCIAPTTCLAVSDAGFVAVRRGTGAWTVTNLGTAGLVAVSCADPDHCVTVDWGGQPFVFDGSAWTSGPRPPADGSRPTSLSCPSRDWCLMAEWAMDGRYLTTTFDGTGWSTPTRVDLGGVWNDPEVACGSPSSCVAWSRGGLGIAGLANGAWQSPILMDQELSAMSCPEVDWCLGLDAIGRQIVYSHGTFTAPTPAVQPTGSLNDASCPAVGHCVAVDGAGNALVLDAGAWSAPVLLDRGQSLQHVSCPTVSYCLAVDSRGAVMTGDGQTWGAPTVIDPGHAFAQVSCGAAGSCTVIDDAARVAMLSDAGWTGFSPLPLQGPAPAAARALSCSSSSSCAAVDGGGRLLWWDGATWTAHAGDPVDLLSMSCASASDCLGLDGGGAVWHRDGRSWSFTYVATRTFGLRMACGGNGRCTALMLDYQHSRFFASSSVGGLWGLPSPVAVATVPKAMACDPAGLCLGLDGTDAVSTFSTS